MYWNIICAIFVLGTNLERNLTTKDQNAHFFRTLGFLIRCCTLEARIQHSLSPHKVSTNLLQKKKYKDGFR